MLTTDIRHWGVEEARGLPSVGEKKMETFVILFVIV